MANTINANLGKTTNIKPDLKADIDLSNANLDKTNLNLSGGLKKDELALLGNAKQPVSSPDGGEQPNGTTPSNAYSDIAGNKEAYSPNSEGKSNTGSGAEAAVGTQYSWNKDAASKAQGTYSSDILTTKQSALTNRQTLENNAVNYQAQADMMKYQNNQNAEKVGWTGGYVLDQNRQSEYLKASIQAQMYGAMELQKYGYDSSLSAARLSYDLNMQEYAHQYYQDAVSEALNEAQLTGTYFSAETKDMMSQLAVAEQKYNDQSLPAAERKQASDLIKTIEGWFSSNGISKEGVKTLAAWEADQANELQWSNELWTRYSTALEAAKTDISTNVDAFIMLDSNGKELWDGVNVSTGDWSKMSSDEISNYLIEDSDVLNNYAVQQFQGFLESKINGSIESGFKIWLQQNDFATKDSDGNYTYPQTTIEMFAKYLVESGIMKDIETKYTNEFKEGSSDKEKNVYTMIKDWMFEIQMPDGTTKSYTYDQLINMEEPKNPPTPIDNEQYDDNVEEWTAHLKDNGYIDTENLKPRAVTLKNGSLTIGSTSYNTNLNTSQINTGKNDDDVDYDIGKKNYDLDIDWNAVGNWVENYIALNTFFARYGTSSNNDEKIKQAQKVWDNAQQYLKVVYPYAKNGDLAFSYVDGQKEPELWMYYDGKWGYVQLNVGGGRLREDLITYMKGGTPARW